MNNSLLMGVLDRSANLDEKFQSFFSGEGMFVAVIGYFHPSHQLHDKVGSSGFSGTRIEHFRDIWVVHERKRLPFGFKSRDDTPGIHAWLDDFQSDAAS